MSRYKTLEQKRYQVKRKAHSESSPLRHREGFTLFVQRSGTNKWLCLIVTFVLFVCLSKKIVRLLLCNIGEWDLVQSWKKCWGVPGAKLVMAPFWNLLLHLGILIYFITSYLFHFIILLFYFILLHLGIFNSI